MKHAKILSSNSSLLTQTRFAFAFLIEAMKLNETKFCWWAMSRAIQIGTIQIVTLPMGREHCVPKGDLISSRDLTVRSGRYALHKIGESEQNLVFIYSDVQWFEIKSNDLRYDRSH